MCEVCPCKQESLSHVIQQCPRSAQARTGRHDAVVRLLTKGLTGRGFTVETKPAITTDHGVRRPDVVAYKPGKEAVIIDVTVIADVPGLLPDAHARKCRKYDVPDVRKWVYKRAKVSPTSVKVTALTFNWRGALCSQSAQDMKKLGIMMPTLEIMSQHVLALLGVGVHCMATVERCHLGPQGHITDTISTTISTFQVRFCTVYMSSFPTMFDVLLLLLSDVSIICSSALFQMCFLIALLM